MCPLCQLSGCCFSYSWLPVCCSPEEVGQNSSFMALNDNNNNKISCCQIGVITKLRHFVLAIFGMAGGCVGCLQCSVSWMWQVKVIAMQQGCVPTQSWWWVGKGCSSAEVWCDITPNEFNSRMLLKWMVLFLWFPSTPKAMWLSQLPLEFSKDSSDGL